MEKITKEELIKELKLAQVDTDNLDKIDGGRKIEEDPCIRVCRILHAFDDCMRMCREITGDKGLNLK